jgi:formylglycine-generating enzyme required for sulfatase activity
MLGNVYEWCADANTGYAAMPDEDPYVHSGGPSRVFRGGSWIFSAHLARAAFRYWLEPATRYPYIGFRLARGQVLRSSAKQS